ncbi:hypothetical protein ABIB82_002235 [Bradyrhizobium sp. i1.8.4]|uniref:hypothetical protein n=1 Tax=unclassified Bradyrhizobium TaxID=2631580 RepID=UPI003D1B20B0
MPTFRGIRAQAPPAGAAEIALKMASCARHEECCVCLQVNFRSDGGELSIADTAYLLIFGKTAGSSSAVMLMGTCCPQIESFRGAFGVNGVSNCVALPAQWAPSLYIAAMPSGQYR